MSLPSSSSGSNDKSGRDVGLEDEDQDVDDDEEEFFEAETLPIIGRCQSLYPFEGNMNDQIFKIFVFLLFEIQSFWPFEFLKASDRTIVRQ